MSTASSIAGLETTAAIDAAMKLDVLAEYTRRQESHRFRKLGIGFPCLRPFQKL